MPKSRTTQRTDPAPTMTLDGWMDIARQYYNYGRLGQRLVEAARTGKVTAEPEEADLPPTYTSDIRGAIREAVFTYWNQTRLPVTISKLVTLTYDVIGDAVREKTWLHTLNGKPRFPGQVTIRRRIAEICEPQRYSPQPSPLIRLGRISLPTSGEPSFMPNPALFTDSVKSEMLRIAEESEP